MKNVMKRLAVCGLCVSMLAGCGEIANNGENNTGRKSIDVESSAAGSRTDDVVEFDTISDLKLKYEDQEKYEYTDPMYNVDKSHVFTYDIGEKFYDVSEYDAFKVYRDGNFENSVDITIEEDIDTNTITIAPGMVFSYEDSQGSSVSDGTWGTRSKFWLVQYLDTETGEQLEKPVVTVFSIEQELNTPTLTQSVGVDGYYKLSWSAVEGADYYEVYEYNAVTDFAELVVTTENLECSNEDFASVKEFEERFKERYRETEIDVDTQWTMNYFLDGGERYFVVGKANDGRCSGMSNDCNPEEIMNQIPVTQSWDFQTEYTGSDVLALPTYVDVEMLDGSIGKYLIEYHGASVTLLEDGSIIVKASIKNLPIAMQQLKFTGMDYDAFMAQSAQLPQRGDEMAAKTGTVTENIDIPYVPESQETTGDTEIDVEEDVEDDIESDIEEDIEEDVAEDVEEDIEEDTDKTDKTVTTAGIELPENVVETVYANSSLSEWIALNLLAHNEEISLDGFNEATDSDILDDALWEAYKQNPLCGTLQSAAYDYETNSIVVTYVQSKEEQQSMQQECLKKAEEIAQTIIKDGMSDYEKEAAINQYLCDNAEYNMQIMEYINGDGTISQEAAREFANSFTPYGVLVENLGVCESYAEAFQLIAREAGLEAVIVTGTMEGVNHQWNRVHLDDKWYTLDVTNNDKELAANALFNLSDEIAAEILKQDSDAIMNEYISNYTADDMKHEYYTVNGLYAEDETTAKEILAKELKESGKAVIRMSDSLGSDAIQEIVQDVMVEAQAGGVQYYSFANVLDIVEQ